MKKRIIIDARLINSSTGRYIERLLTHLQTVDTKNEYVVLVPTKDLSYWKPHAKNFTVVECNYKNYSINEQFGFLRQLYALKADLVHFCMPQQPLFYLKPHVTTIHDLTLLKTYNSDKNWLIYHVKQLVGRFLFWWVARSSAHILVPSRFTLEEYARFSSVSEEKMTLTYEAAEISKVKPKKINLPYKEYLLYVGSQSDYKNIRGLVLAHQKLLETRPELGLVLVGGLNQAARRNKVWVEKEEHSNVHFTGFVSDSELTYLYQNCGAYVFPSLMEGFGLPGLEAMVQGAPVVSSDASCLPEIYGEAAEYFDPESVYDMVAAIERVLDDEMLRVSLINRGHIQVKKYSWVTMAEQTHAVYMKVLANRKAS